MNENGRGDWIRTSSDRWSSLEVSRSNRLRLSLPCRMLAGLRARELLRLSPFSYFPLLPSSKEPVHVVDSFSLTAAGQSRIFTGFPFTL